MSLKPAEIFSYELPAERIAQRPVYPYDQAKLLVCSRDRKELQDSSFDRIDSYLMPGDVLVFNDSKVLAARLSARKVDTGAIIELLLTREVARNEWEVLAKPLKKLKAGTELKLAAGVEARVVEKISGSGCLVKFHSESGIDIKQNLEQLGCMPIPPYIRNGKGDHNDIMDYQSIFAEYSGSIAAPTASLHFTPPLIEKIKDSGVKILTSTLHVGKASFLQLWQEGADTISAPGEENFTIPDAVWKEIQIARDNKQRIIAVGTTIVRALESRALNANGSTSLFIKPGFDFKVCDAVITNFHQPGTTHLLLVQALLGKNLLEKSYEFALKNDYRFLSYGDGMLIC